VEEVPSPALLLYPERVEENIRRMVAMAGRVAQLRPHIKTHKLPQLVAMQLAHGVTKFKAATIAEVEMAATCGAPDVLLAYQPVGPNVHRLLELTHRFPKTEFSALVDDARTAAALSDAFASAGAMLDVLVDVDCGMHRTGVDPGAPATELCATLAKLPGLRLAGLHAYDGHLHDSDVALRTRRCEEAFAPVQRLRAQIGARERRAARVVAGGTPTFAIHARRGDVECSPGTCLLWDAGYGTKLPDLDFLPAALVLTRVISKPGPGRLCLDLGHKAIASENPHPRVQFLGVGENRAVGHSEEHLVIETDAASKYDVGAAWYGIPWHICPTVALHAEAVVVKNGLAEAQWRIVARERHLTV
jgi:D-serine deaminase-like pyridoxal phosphate-dependent protein